MFRLSSRGEVLHCLFMSCGKNENTIVTHFAAGCRFAGLSVVITPSRWSAMKGTETNPLILENFAQTFWYTLTWVRIGVCDLDLLLTFGSLVACLAYWFESWGGRLYRHIVSYQEKIIFIFFISLCGDSSRVSFCLWKSLLPPEGSMIPKEKIHLRCRNV